MFLNSEEDDVKVNKKEKESENSNQKDQKPRKKSII